MSIRHPSTGVAPFARAASASVTFGIRTTPKWSLLHDKEGQGLDPEINAFDPL
jgi:hypothetical protein